jgi:hypothetical protein
VRGGILATRIGVQDQRPPTLRAAFVTELGPPENIQVGELPTPEVSAFDVLVRTRALAVNYVDTFDSFRQVSNADARSVHHRT